jgi:hypothetical protein
VTGYHKAPYSSNILHSALTTVLRTDVRLK